MLGGRSIDERGETYDVCVVGVDGVIVEIWLRNDIRTVNVSKVQLL